MNPRHFTRSTRIAGVCVLGLGAALALTACGPAASSAAGAAASSAAPAVSSQTATSAPAAATASAPAPTASATAARTAAPVATLVPMQTSAGGEFLSPSGNISCEIDYKRARLTQVYCQTGMPARSVTMVVTGKYTTCTGQHCLGNPGEHTPTLAYGTATGVGPFRCESAAAGVTCVAGGKGFRISTSGVAPVSS